MVWYKSKEKKRKKEGRKLTSDLLVSKVVFRDRVGLECHQEGLDVFLDLLEGHTCLRKTMGGKKKIRKMFYDHASFTSSKNECPISP